MLDLIVRGGTVVSPDRRYAADVGMADERVVAITTPGGLDGEATRHTFDATGLWVLPGVVDGHVHFREPGFEHKEDWGSGSRAAVMGGVTTVLEMPNSLPSTATAELVLAKQRLAEGKSYCDFGLLGLLAQDNLDQLEPMASAGVVGYKCFLGESTGGIVPPDDGVLLDAMRRIGEIGLRIGFHAENNAILQHRVRQLKAAGRTDPLAHEESHPIVAEVEAIQRAALFARVSGARIHILHLTSRQGLDAIEAWRARGVDVTCEVTPQHCFLSTDDVPALGPMVRINPPVREPGQGAALLQALASGRIDAIGSDHSPHLLEEKTRDNIWDALSGFAGVETSVRLFLTDAVNAGMLTLEEYVLASSAGPARLWGLFPRKGAIAVGADADLTIVDLDRPGVIDRARLHGRNNHTPFEGRQTRGEAVATVVRGQVVMREGELVGEPRGRLVRPLRQPRAGRPAAAAAPASAAAPAAARARRQP
jgi:dihydroorotase